MPFFHLKKGMNEIHTYFLRKKITFVRLQMTSLVLELVGRVYPYKICLLFRFCCENGKAKELS